MKKKTNLRLLFGFSLHILLILACSMPGGVRETLSPENLAQTQQAEIRNALAGTQTALALAETPQNEEAAPSVDIAPPTEAITHLITPGEPPNHYTNYIIDRDSSSTAPQRAANGGENFDTNLYERPFNAMTLDIYYPDLDIREAGIDPTGTWVYAEIEFVDVNPQGGMNGNYGIELDLDIDGRGDWLILASKPQANWSTEGVRVWQDTNNDIGNDYPARADHPQKGDGHDLLYFDQGNNPDPDIAWARVSPQNPKLIQIAFKPSLIANDNYFMWGAWADQGVFNPAFYDYNDHFTHTEAGSPLPGLQKYYPLKALFEVDNTCREAYGFILKGDEPGACPVYKPPTATAVPTATKEPPPTPTRKPPPTPTRKPPPTPTVPILY